MADLTLVLGGARSGKSRHGEALVRAASGVLPPVYIATAQAFDAEMEARIARHRAERAGDGWQDIEAPQDLAEALASAPAGAAVLIDCLTLWLSNHLLAGHDLDAECRALREALTARAGVVVAVANEVGLGIVPENALARRFRDAAGRLNQDLAAQAGRVVFIAAGLPLVLKGQA
ncbi:MAG: bifunctional adenosylcobinamide kinase/adenosylcobinamide-phosphate guanylyltransferase [Pararhodobacter sp.]